MRHCYWIILAVVFLAAATLSSMRARTRTNKERVRNAKVEEDVGRVLTPIRPFPRGPEIPEHHAIAPGAAQWGGAYDPSETRAWIAGYRPAQGLPFESAMAVSVIGPNGPLEGEPVQVEFVFAFLSPEERLNGVVMSGVKDEGDGTRWISRYGLTGATGTARIEDLPYVQCKVSVAGRTVVSYPTTNLRIEAEPLAEDLFRPGRHGGK